MNHREVAKRVLRIATGTEPTEDQVDRLVDARKDGLRMRFVDVVSLVSPTAPSISTSIGGPFQPGDVVECIDRDVAQTLKNGKRYEVIRVSGGSGGKFVYIRASGIDPEYGFYANRFRLVSRVER